MTDRQWDLTFTSDTESVRFENVTPETRPTINIEEELRIEDGKEVWYPKKDDDGKVVSHWLPIIIGNIGGAPQFPSQPLTACMELSENGEVVERWSFARAKPQFFGQHLQVEFEECNYQRKGINL